MVIGYEIRSPDKIKQEILQQKEMRSPVILLVESIRELSPDDMIPVYAEPQNAQRMKRLHTVESLVLIQQLTGNGTDGQIHSIHLELHDQWCFPIHQLQHLVDM